MDEICPQMHANLPFKACSCLLSPKPTLSTTFAATSGTFHHHIQGAQPFNGITRSFAENFTQNSAKQSENGNVQQLQTVEQEI